MIALGRAIASDRVFSRREPSCIGGNVLSETVRAFIHQHIKSIWALELLLLLRRDTGRHWTVGQLTAELRSSHTAVEDIVTSFRSSGLIRDVADGSIFYAPADALRERLCAEVERAYSERPLAIVKEIMAAPNDKIQNFADAFRLR